MRAYAWVFYTSHCNRTVFLKIIFYKKDNARFFNGDLSKVPKKAITMGVGTIMDAKELVLMATGKGKAAAIKATIEGISLKKQTNKIQY